MSYTKVKSVMATPVVAAHELTPYRQLVRLLAENKIGFLPVVDDAGTLVGVVSESDLLHKEANRHAADRPLLLERRRRRSRREKAAGTVAAELMTSPALTIKPWESATHAAQVMQERGIRHLVVVDEHGQVAGVVGRGDVLRVYLRDDDEIEREIIHNVLQHELLLSPRNFQVAVSGGVVTVKGHVQRRTMADTLVSAVEGVEGVTRLDTRVTWRLDDTQRHDRAPYSMYGVA